jgi:ribosome biogenesis GTPase A
MAHNQSLYLFPKLTLFRVWLAFLWEDAPMEVQVRKDKDFHDLALKVISFQDFLSEIRDLRDLGSTARVDIVHYPDDCRERPCLIRVVFQ